MNYRQVILSSLASLGLVLGVARGIPAQITHTGSLEAPSAEQTNQFQPIEQPLWARVIVTGAGLGLISLELWWFVFSQPKSRKDKSSGRLQD